MVVCQGKNGSKQSKVHSLIQKFIRVAFVYSKMRLWSFRFVSMVGMRTKEKEEEKKMKYENQMTEDALRFRFALTLHLYLTMFNKSSDHIT